MRHILRSGWFAFHFPRHGTPFLVVTLLFLYSLAAPIRASDLEKQLVSHAPEVVKFCAEKGYKNVGVLKFIIKKDNSDDKPADFSDRAGPLNLDAAARLEMAMVLALRPGQTLGIVHDASKIAAQTKGANHLSPDGRKKLFEPKYPLAWGTETVLVDALIAGSLELTADLKQIKVRLAAFTAEGKLERITEFAAAMDVEKLAEVGESFVLRGAFDKGNIEQVALNDAAKTRDSAKEVPHPASSPDAPVELLITYNEQPVAIETRDGKAFVREPSESDKVVLTLKRKNPTDTKRYAIVLKVNGENTLEKQKLRDLQCRKWILQPGDPPIAVRGFQMSDSKAEAFRVLSKAASKAREIDYGEDVGQISLVVFREKPKDAKPPADLPDDNADDLAALTRSVFPAQPAESVAALQAQLRADGSRGLLTGGQEIDSKTRAVTFEADPTPIMSSTIIYYKP